MEMNKMIGEIKRDIKNNSITKIVANCAFGSAMSLTISKSMGIGCHNKYIMPSFDNVLQDLNEYYLDDDFSNHVKVRNENLEYEYDENEEIYKSFTYFEVKDLSISIKATIIVDHCCHYLSFEFSPMMKPGMIIGTLNATKYQYKDFNIVPIEKHIYDMLFNFTMDYYNLYSDDID